MFIKMNKRFLSQKIIKNNLSSIRKDFTALKTKVKTMDRTPLYLVMILLGSLAVLSVTKVIKDSNEKTPAADSNYSEVTMSGEEMEAENALKATEPSSPSREKGGRLSANSALTASVESKINEDPSLSALDLVVTTKGSVVQISGDLSSGEEASKAVELANSVPGVTDVDTSNLTVNYALPSSDMIINGKVKGIFKRYRLFGDKTMEEVGLHVDTHEGIVNLTGTVHTEKQAKNVIKFAKTINGVKGVVSQITIYGKGPMKKSDKNRQQNGLY